MAVRGLVARCLAAIRCVLSSLSSFLSSSDGPRLFVVSVVSGVLVLKGLIASVSASFLFGVLYYLAPALAPLDGEQIFGWRVLCTLPFTTLLVFWRGEVAKVFLLCQRVLRQPSYGLALLFSAAMLGGQLWLFLWAPIHGRALAVSLGYFLLPLVMVLAGRVIFRERLTRGQSLATGLAGLGVLHELLTAGGLAWETWFVAVGYTVYFAFRRRIGSDNIGGHWLDMALLAPVALWFVARPPSSFVLVAQHSHLWLLIPVLGVLSAVALALYMMASRLLPLGLFGLLSYVEPVLLALVAFLLGESIEPGQWWTYGPIFAAVVCLVVESTWQVMRSGQKVPAH